MNKIRVLVVDDTALMRKIISDILKRDPEIEVVGTAANGYIALQKIKRLNPDVVTMDVEMPKMDGLTALSKIMEEHPVPVIMVSSHTYEGAKVTLEALELGAFDFIPKPTGIKSEAFEIIADSLISKVKAAAGAKLAKRKKEAKEETVLQKVEDISKGKFVVDIVGIGISTGGPPSLRTIFKKFPGDYPVPITLVQHMPPGFTKALAERLDKISKLHVKEAENGEKLEKYTVYVAPGDYHMEIRNQRVVLRKGERIWGQRPAADPLFFSIAEEYGKFSLGVVMTGMGRDGASGLKKIKEKGGRTIAQNKETCVVFGMPRVAIEEGSVDLVVPLEEIPEAIIKMSTKEE